MAQRIEAAKMVGPAVAPPPVEHYNEGTPAVEDAQSVEPNYGDSSSSGENSPERRAQPVPEVQSEAEENMVVEDVRRHLGIADRDLNFQVNQDTGDVIVQVKDKETGRVERQIPSDEILRIQENIRQIAGTLFHRTA